MDNDILIAIISGLAVSIPNIVATVATINRNNTIQDERIANIQSDLKKLTDKVDSQSNLETRISVLETELRNLKK
jgi:hypothetical protein